MFFLCSTRRFSNCSTCLWFKKYEAYVSLIISKKFRTWETKFRFFMKRVVLLRFVKDCYNTVLNAEDLFPGSVLYYKGHTLYAASGTDVKEISSLML